MARERSETSSLQSHCGIYLRKKEQEAQILKQREKFDELLSTLKATEEKLQSANEVITMMEKEIYDKE